MTAGNQSMQVTVYDPVVAEKLGRAVEKITGQKPQIIKAYVIVEPRLSQKEGLILLGWMKRNIRLNYITREVLMKAAHSLNLMLGTRTGFNPLLNPDPTPWDEGDVTEEDDVTEEEPTRSSRPANGRRQGRRVP